MELSKKVGLVVPIYNASRFLRECLEAILNQSYQNLEVVLVDDGSTDKESVEIAKEYVTTPAPTPLSLRALIFSPNLFPMAGGGGIY